MFPILLAPYGLTTILTPPLPMPSAINVEFLPPLDWTRYGPEAADDEAIVAACYAEITGCHADGAGPHARTEPTSRRSGAGATSCAPGGRA